MSRHYYYFFIIFFFFSTTTCQAQKKVDIWVKKFKSEFYASYQKNKRSSFAKYKKLSASQNAHHFMYLSIGVNALNMMYEATGDMKYLEDNTKLIKNVINHSVKLPVQWNYDKKTKLSSVGQEKFMGWKVRSENASSRVKNRDWMLYEGYLFRYVMQYLYILKEYNIIDKYPKYEEDYKKILTYVKYNVWNKWEQRSLLNRGDYSRFYATRTHMGSHWAAIASYLKKLIDDPEQKKVYTKVINRYDKLLRNNFKVKGEGQRTYYIWNSTYNFITSEKNKPYMRSEDNSIIQDLTHGNQVVSYIITSFNLGYSEWNSSDIQKLVNTVLYNNWDESQKKFHDSLIAGATISDRLRGTGYKQSRGWIKLAYFDKDLLKLYEEFYKYNKDKIDSSSLSIQFYAQMAYNYTKK